MKKTTKPTGALKSLVNAGKNPSRVLTSVERWSLALPGDKSRRMDVIHPSAMIKSDWCHRAQYFLLKGHTPDPRVLTRKQQAVFQTGHDVHARWQDLFAKMGTLYGTWRCTDCRFKWEGLSKDIGRCICCNSLRKPEYLEVPVSNKALNISGHADGWLKGFDGDLLLEIKSIGAGTIIWEDPNFWYSMDSNFEAAWAALKEPFYSHIMQTQVYLRLLQDMYGDDAPKEVLFIYENKLTQDAKEFIIPRSGFGITHLFEAAEMLADAVVNGVAPTCNVNASGSCKQCLEFSEVDSVVD